MEVFSGSLSQVSVQNGDFLAIPAVPGKSIIPVAICIFYTGVGDQWTCNAGSEIWAGWDSVGGFGGWNKVQSTPELISAASQTVHSFSIQNLTYYKGVGGTTGDLVGKDFGFMFFDAGSANSGITCKIYYMLA